MTAARGRFGTPVFAQSLLEENDSSVSRINPSKKPEADLGGQGALAGGGGGVFGPVLKGGRRGE